MEQATQYRRHRQVQGQRILDTAQRLFITRGLGDVTLTQIAPACGITRATLYRYFNSKERILWEIHHLRMRQYGENLRALLGGRRLTTLERLTAFCNFLYAEFERDPGVFLFLRACLTAPTSRALRPGPTAFMKRCSTPAISALATQCNCWRPIFTTAACAQTWSPCRPARR